ncbi:P-loop containing nucleoside triphosphate hydrolase protein [Xylariaceae sp. AK1471]|nr:P-loop containing nucleoside triphosphate hydrolase protein [Xylariaceae sp. AK1471]
MEGHGYEEEDSLFVTHTYDGQDDSLSIKYKTNAPGGDCNGSHTSRYNNAIKRIGEDPGSSSTIASGKRKSAQPGPPAEAKSYKRRKRGPTKLNAEKAELGKQLENMFDWTSRMLDPTSETSGYTPEQFKHDEVQLGEAVTVFGSKAKPEGQEDDYPNRLFRVEGMSTTIRDYQVVGAGFMLRQERSRNDCRGGIIADDMGIGKTVQSIACILAHRPSMRAKSEGQGATLIIVPNQGLMRQWAEELKRHANAAKKEICKYIGGGKISALGIQGYPYVLATYSQVEREFRLQNSTKEDEDLAPLFDVEFFRIILDEGDNIRNFYGSTSIACGELKAKLKWILSGTPLRNSVQECLPYFRFLGIDIEKKQLDFEKRWGRPKSNTENDRTIQVLAHRMFRREAGQLFMGREVCKLPKSHFEDRLLSISNEEAIISRNLEDAFLRREEEARERKRKGEEYDPTAPKSNHRVRCTRLRQAVDHPFLLEACIRDVLKRDELKDLIKELVGHKRSKSMKHESPCPTESGSEQHESSIYSMAIDMIPHLDDTLLYKDNEGCLECFSVVELQLLECLGLLTFLRCGHVICRKCYEEHIGNAVMQGKIQCRCPWCGKIIAHMPKPDRSSDPNRRFQEGSGAVKLKSEVLKTPDGRSISVVPPRDLKKRCPGDDYNGIQLKMSNASCRWLRKCDNLGQVTPSTKTKAAMDIVKEWQDEAPDDKIVIFMEWIATANVLGRLLGRSNINFVYYNGAITVKDRNKNLEDFKSDPDIKILIASMGTGNVGLNITSANRVIIMTPWWNYAAETQAFGRVKRHGQRKDTYLVRLFAKDTIDERIYHLQKMKEAEIKEAMKEGRKPKPLSRAEKLWLMGDRKALESPFDESDEETLGDIQDLITN